VASELSSRRSLLWCVTKVAHGRRVGRWVFGTCPTGFFCARFLVPSESPIVCDTVSTLATSGQPRHFALLVSAPRPLFLARICWCSWLCVFWFRVLSLISIRSACVCFERGKLDIAVLVHDDAGSRYALLRFVNLFLVLPEPAKPYGYTFYFFRELGFWD
jgi:hypothetical protein